MVPSDYLPELKIIKKIKPSSKEVNENPRSRSATLRVAIKLKEE